MKKTVHLKTWKSNSMRYLRWKPLAKIKALTKCLSKQQIDNQHIQRKFHWQEQTKWIQHRPVLFERLISVYWKAKHIMQVQNAERCVFWVMTLAYLNHRCLRGTCLCHESPWIKQPRAEKFICQPSNVNSLSTMTCHSLMSLNGIFALVSLHLDSGCPLLSGSLGPWKLSCVLPHFLSHGCGKPTVFKGNVSSVKTLFCRDLN